MLLAACDLAPEKISFSEVSLEDVDNDVKEFVDSRKLDEDGTGNGIYLYYEGERKYYLYLSQGFLDSSNGFGNIALKNPGNRH